MNDQSLAGTNPQIPPINPNNTNKSPNPVAMPEAFLPFRPLLPSADSLPSFPLDSLPPVLRDYVEAVAMHTQTSPDMAAAIGLTVLAIPLQGKIEVEGNYGHFEQTSLYSLIIASPGERKSGVMREMTDVISDYEQEANERLKPLIRRNKQERESLLRDVARLTRQLEQKYDKMTELELQNTQDKLADLPTLKPVQYFTDNCTSESLIKLLNDNGGRMAVISAEAGVFDNISGMYSSKVNLDPWLKARDGDTIRVDRIQRDPEYIRHPALSVVLTAQPSVLAEIMGNRQMSGRGFLARFMYVIVRPVKRTFRSYPISKTVKDRYRAMIYSLMDIPTDQMITLYLSNEAAESMSSFFDWMEMFLATDGQDMREWGNKLCGMILRIAGLLHMAGDNADSTEISNETICNAIQIGRFALAHAKYAFGQVGHDQNVTKAMFVVNRIHKHHITRVSRADLYQLCRGSFFEDADAFEPTLDLLEDHGYISREAMMYSGRGRPRKEVITVSPMLFNGPAG